MSGIIAAEKDVDAKDEYGVRYFWPMDYQDKERAGKPIDLYHRQQLIRKVKEYRSKRKEWEGKPVLRKEYEALYTNLLAPIGKQIQTLTFQLMAMRKFMFEKLEIDIDEYEKFIQEKVREYSQASIDKVADTHGIGSTIDAGVSKDVLEAVETTMTTRKDGSEWAVKILDDEMFNTDGTPFIDDTEALPNE